MQFQVPQFIETEDKIIGPFTLKQFLYLAAAGGLSFLSFFVLETFLWLIVTMLAGTVAAAFAFIKYNGRPLPAIALSGFKYLWNPRMYLWQKAEREIETPKIKTPKVTKVTPPRISLKTLWLKLTTSNELVKKKPAVMETIKEKFAVFKKLTGEREVARRVDYR